LVTLTKKDKEKLLEKEFVLCKEICDDPAILSLAGIDRKKHKKIIENARELEECMP
jgi:hypothetical protein